MWNLIPQDPLWGFSRLFFYLPPEWVSQMESAKVHQPVPFWVPTPPWFSVSAAIIHDWRHRWARRQLSAHPFGCLRLGMKYILRCAGGDFCLRQIKSRVIFSCKGAAHSSAGVFQTANFSAKYLNIFGAWVRLPLEVCEHAVQYSCTQMVQKMSADATSQTFPLSKRPGDTFLH